ncbi:hypothetical protein FRB90_002824 [Tulasnella sp. 427]|nr:hypothetical protein FRB90_002824 [Tulasnella sp. 427]
MRLSILFSTCTLIICAYAHPLHSIPQHNNVMIARGRNGDGTFNKHAAVDYTTYNTEPTQAGSSKSEPSPTNNSDSSQSKPDASQEATGHKKITPAHNWKA